MLCIDYNNIHAWVYITKFDDEIILTIGICHIVSRGDIIYRKYNKLTKTRNHNIEHIIMFRKSHPNITALLYYNARTFWEPIVLLF